ncbi:DUF4867 family protein [Clostridium sp.]|uniref:ureidoglycolate lyase n=1 Tax=Clostridium sp. TaxID=1506 RepID=UPI001A415263|nr:DUF4867 family protein [Clostridium sp.]MBK5236475.1 DUF4867 family protein [Clostridium sp.]
MRKIKANIINNDNFKKFGCFYDMINPQGNNLGDFYPDHLINPMNKSMSTGFSSLKVYKPNKMIVETVEYHNYTGEILLPIDTDIVIHVAPPSVEIKPELTEAFIIKKGTIVKLNVGVYHLAPFSIDKEEGHVMVVLPERTYKNDCIVINYPIENQIEITL